MIAALKGLTYHYPGGEAPALNDVSVTFAEGSFTLLAGPSGGGKSTLLRVLNGLVPQFHGGRLGGASCVAGLDPARTPARQMAALAGMVFQEPEAQSVSDTVEDEIAFGMEQRGTPPARMRETLDALLRTLEIERLRGRRLATLSGGERQRVAIAAVLAVAPRLLLLDEPTSQLDPDGAGQVLDAVEKLRREGGLSVVIAEHRLDRLLARVDAVIEVKDGRARQFEPRQAARELDAAATVSMLGRALSLHPVPLTLEEAARAIAALARPPTVSVADSVAVGAEILRVSGATVRYGATAALSGVELSVREGEVVALVGPNGSGKSTLFRAVSGLTKLDGGDMRFRGVPAPRDVRDRTAVAGFLPQDPTMALYRDSVRDEIAESLGYRGAGKRAAAALVEWDIEPFAARNPRDLSVGQQQRVAAAAMLAHQPPLWMLDEPTRGADYRAKQWLAARLRAHAAAGGAAIVATHDMECAATFATRVVGLGAGEIAFDLPARKAFAADGPLPTQVARLVPGAIIVAEVRP